MVTKLVTTRSNRNFRQPQTVIKPDDLVVRENSGITEIVQAIKEIREKELIEYENEEQKLDDQRRFVNDRLLALLEATQPGVNVYSIEHIQVANGILETYIDLNGLKKPVNKKPEAQKPNFNINLEFGKPRD